MSITNKVKNLKRHSSRRYKVITARLIKQGFRGERLVNAVRWTRDAIKDGSFDELVAWDRVPGRRREVLEKHRPEFDKLFIR